MIFDSAGRLLVLKPTYKAGWTIPGGVMEGNGETPWEACRREVAEETAIAIDTARLAAVDFRPAKPGRPGGIRFLFDCGRLPDEVLERVVVQPAEIETHALLDPDEALDRLSGPLRRRVGAALGRTACVYLEDGRPVDGISNPDGAGRSR
jgi:ADP-ribose pyrophosphatase YjhB (NUDIX family)